MLTNLYDLGIERLKIEPRVRLSNHVLYTVFGPDPRKGRSYWHELSGYLEVVNIYVKES